MKSTIALASVLTLGLPLAACEGTDDGGSGDDAADTASRVTQLRSCTYDDFSVEVTGGPSAGKTFAGELTVYERVGTKSFTGALATEESVFYVSGQYGTGNRITVTVDVGDGYVVGIGPANVALCADADAMIEGVATGPVIAADNTIEGTDTGHWLLAHPRLEEIFVINVDLGDFDIGDLEGGHEGPLKISINIPDSVIANCTRNNVTDTDCLQRFCTGQLAGTVRTPDVAQSGYTCQSNN